MENKVDNKKEDRVRVGAMWLNTAKSGDQYLTGKLENGTKIIGWFHEETINDPDNRKPYLTIFEKQ